jgi:uncharacterized membrane protein
MKIDFTFDQHDLLGFLIVAAAFTFNAFKLIDGVTLLGALGVASGLILASNTSLLSGKTNDTTPHA